KRKSWRSKSKAASLLLDLLPFLKKTQKKDLALKIKSSEPAARPFAAFEKNAKERAGAPNQKRRACGSTFCRF
ncbi:MAG: hypothetical protein KIG29_01400, partial [Oscillospiraceae bacterium]|nr:hypothetical protein [Oscillospiraceae bacterium]